MPKIDKPTIGTLALWYSEVTLASNSDGLHDTLYYIMSPAGVSPVWREVHVWQITDKRRKTCNAAGRIRNERVVDCCDRRRAHRGLGVRRTWTSRTGAGGIVMRSDQSRHADRRDGQRTGDGRDVDDGRLRFALSHGQRRAHVSLRGGGGGSRQDRSDVHRGRSVPLSDGGRRHANDGQRRRRRGLRRASGAKFGGGRLPGGGDDVGGTQAR